MTHMLYSLHAIILFIVLCVQYLPVSIATPKYHSIPGSRILSLNSLKKCDSYWWNNRQDFNEWSGKEKWNKNYHDHSLRKLSEKKICSNWKKFAQCRCESVEWGIKNPAGTYACYQISWFNKASGNFVGELTVFKSSSMNKFKGKHSHVAFKFSKFDVKIHESSHLNLDSSGFYHAISPRFAWEQNGILIQKFYVHGKISSNKIINEEILVNILSPSKYKVIISSKLVFVLKKNYDAENLPFSNYVPHRPFCPVVDNRPYKYKPDDRTPRNSTRPPNNSAKPTDIHSKNPDNTKPTDIPSKDTLGNSTRPPYNSAKPTDIPSKYPDNIKPTDIPSKDTPVATSTNTPTNTLPTTTPTKIPEDKQTDPAVISSNPAPIPTENSKIAPNVADNSPNVVNSAADSSPTSSSSLPGTTFSIAPIGLTIFSVIILIGIAFVLYSRYKNSKWKKQFRQRQEVADSNIAIGSNV